MAAVAGTSKETLLPRSVSRKRSSEVFESIDSPSSSLSETQNSKKRKLEGIVIDGKTYTCATCKGGHRVGVCKHARERPMKATHPPGRPAAGAPKKVKCTCPKNCRCSKKDCKCARPCSCTQTMYMLVYIPGPGEEANPAPEEETGEWKVDRAVTTDLKGNVLSEEEIKQREAQRKEQNGSHPLSRSRSVSTLEPPTTPSQAKPKASGGCCKHKQVVEKERQQAQVGADKNESAQVGQVTNPSIHGCNCGAACSCAFCPQHPNNQTSQNLALQQAMYMSGQQIHPSSEQFLPFTPSVPSQMSCMGGQPRFAVSTTPMQPSFATFGQAFPATNVGGYMLAYPVRGPFQHMAQVPGHYPVQPILIPASWAQMSRSALTMPQIQVAPNPAAFDFGQGAFDIGSAFVASDGPEGWQTNTSFPEGSWPLPDFELDTDPTLFTESSADACHVVDKTSVEEDRITSASPSSSAQIALATLQKSIAMDNDEWTRSDFSTYTSTAKEVFEDPVDCLDPILLERSQSVHDTFS